MKVLIGSRALAYWRKDLILKPETDWDVISDKPLEGTEWHNASFLNNAEMHKYATGHIVNGFQVMSMEGLALIKRSHLWRNLSFGKHITHYYKYGLWRFFLNNQDYENRLRLSYKAFPQAFPKLNQSVADFFDDAITKVYDHDYLHELLAYYDKPLYTKLQKDSRMAWCDKELWYNLSYQDKVRCVAEETKVIAVERFLVPSNWNCNSKLAYLKSLEKVCTTLCSGWFRDFAIDHYPEVIAEYDHQQFVDVSSILKGE